MRRILVVILLMAALAPVATAQVPDVENPNWTAGWEVEEDETIMDLDDIFQFETILTFWIDNSRPLPSDFQIDVEITYPDKCDENSFSIDYESNVNVGANANETFEIKISGSALLTEGYDQPTPCPTSEKFSLELAVTDLIVAGQTGEPNSRLNYQDLRYSPVYGFEVTFQPIINGKGPEVKAGTDEQIDVLIWITGNSGDAISKIDMSFRGCPQMKFDKIPDSLSTGTEVQYNDGYKSGIVVLSAPSSHPDKTCTFVVSVTSEGNGISYTGEVEFVVEAPDVKVEDNDEDESATETSDFEVEDSSLPAISSLLCILTVLLSAVIRRN